MIYMDNSSTSWPKAPGVSGQICAYLDDLGTSGGRGAYPAAVAADRLIYNTRQSISHSIGFSHADHLIFTKGATESLNLVLSGLFKKGDRVLTTGYEHNSVLRPLHHLGVHLCVMDSVDTIAIPRLPDMPIDGVVMTAASNVTGAIQPIAEMGQLCRLHGLPFIVDGAQGVGALDINMDAQNISALCFGAHKAMLGPQGIGALALCPEIAQKIPPLNFGGTGTNSANPAMPEQCPEKFEAGTMNMPGIAGWNAAIEYLNKEAHTLRPAMDARKIQLLEGLTAISGITLYGPHNAKDRVGVFSVDFHKQDNSLCAHRLSEEFDIAVRSGLHCAPAAHNALGTEKTGLVRFSLSPFNTVDEVAAALHAVTTIARG